MNLRETAISLGLRKHISLSISVGFSNESVGYDAGQILQRSEIHGKFQLRILSMFLFLFESLQE